MDHEHDNVAVVGAPIRIVEILKNNNCGGYFSLVFCFVAAEF